MKVCKWHYVPFSDMNELRISQMEKRYSLLFIILLITTDKMNLL